ncbi:MFS transporter [Streptomyces sp. LB8]|uniref:MFS transporter n=1 Tax=Streptomyces sp. LB8 TaxID=3042509 RepID=UPI002647FC67|nr:MFS transporter [Streptomyces sp. LB8]MDN5385620.1 MFS transporter [Streptomyces sp. LB8]
MVRATSTETRREKTAEQEGRSRRRWAVLGVLGVASFFDGLDANIVAVSLPSIQRDLGTGFATAQWAVAGYSLATAVLLITGGRLGDLHGTKRVFLAGLGGFTLFSGVCALAVTAEMLVAGRVGQGAMAALMLPQAMAVTKRHFQPQEWGLASAVTGVAITAGSIGGPVVGGFLTDLDLFGTGWRAVFWINVPVGAVTLVCGARVLSEGRARRRPMLDLPSTALVTAASLGLMYPLVQGREHGWPSWTPVMLAVAAGLWLLFAIRQRRCAVKGREPLVPPSLFRLPSFTAGLVTALLTFAGATSFTFVLTYYLQFGAAWSRRGRLSRSRPCRWASPRSSSSPGSTAPTARGCSWRRGRWPCPAERWRPWRSPGRRGRSRGSFPSWRRPSSRAWEPVCAHRCSPRCCSAPCRRATRVPVPG